MLAAVLGGTQSLHTNSKDEALALPTEDSVRVALRTQQIVAYESGVTDTIDSLAGSYYIESLTNKIEEALRLIQKIDELGGAPQAIEKGFIQQEIMYSAYKYQKEIESEDKVIVGVNKLQIDEESPKVLLKVDSMIGERQKEKINELKAKRDNEKVKNTLESLREAWNSYKNVMPSILDSVRAYVTLGEVCGVMREEFGEYKQTIRYRRKIYMRPIRVLVVKPGLDGHDRGAKVIAREVWRLYILGFVKLQNEL